MFLDHPLIEADPEIMMGKPAIRGTRITVEHILRELAGGRSIDDLLDGHPQLTRETIRAALFFAADSVRVDFYRPVQAVRE